MEGMGKEICLDSDILIDILDGEKLILDDYKDFKIFITSISAFEYALGKVSYEQSIEVLSKFFALKLEVIDAVLSADIYKKLRNMGKEVEFRDIMIASICINNNITLLTRNKKHFSRFVDYGLKIIYLE